MTFRQLWRKMIKMKTRSQLLTLRSGTQQSGAAFGNSPTKQAKLKKKGIFFHLSWRVRFHSKKHVLFRVYVNFGGG
jgi:hypothetical protein